MGLNSVYQMYQSECLYSNQTGVMKNCHKQIKINHCMFIGAIAQNEKVAEKAWARQHFFCTKLFSSPESLDYHTLRGNKYKRLWGQEWPRMHQTLSPGCSRKSNIVEQWKIKERKLRFGLIKIFSTHLDN